jgi:uncharacterized delta-60 repeat protein
LTALAAMVAIALLTTSAWAHDSGFGIARYTPDGALDRSFGNAGLVVIRSAQRSFVADALAVQPDGKIVMGGMSSDVSSGNIQLAVARYNGDGTADDNFSSGGMATTPLGFAGAEANAVALQPDGMILVVGTAYSHGSANDTLFVARFTSSGVLDSSFGTAGVTTTQVGTGASGAAALALQPDGRIIVAGTAFSNGATDDDFAIVRYKSSGRLDADFGSGGVVTTDFSSSDPGGGASLDRAGAVALQTDGQIVVAGFTRGDRQSFAVARYNPDGSLDPRFGSGGKMQIAAAEPQVYSVVVQHSGDIVLAGSAASSTRGTASFALVRLRSDGRADESFGSGGLVTTTFEGSRSGARSVVVQSDGKLITAGAKFGAPSAQGDALPESGFALARYNSDGSIDSSFGDRGRALTSMGDAGATPLSLAVQSDGKILAAGLVFFQVPAAAPRDWLLLVPLSSAAQAAGLALAAIILAVILMRRRARTG